MCYASDFHLIMPCVSCYKNNLAKITGFKWTSQGFLKGGMVSSDTDILNLRFMLQSLRMLFVDYTMTNIKNICLIKSLGSVPASTPSDVAPLIMNFIWQYQVFKESLAKDTLERQNISADF